MSKNETDIIETSDVEPRQRLQQNATSPVITDFMRRVLATAGIIAIVLGLLAFILGGNTLSTIVVIFGLFSLFTVFIDLMLFTKSRLLRGAHLMNALLATIMGLVLLFRQDVAGTFAGLIFGFWILLNATGNLAQSWVSEMLSGWQRLVGLIIGVTGLVLGLYLVLFTGYPARLLSIFVGSYADLLGIFYLLTAFFSRKASSSL
jgi:uncharacterized membrane protein HdeD (DUF308 family)